MFDVMPVIVQKLPDICILLVQGDLNIAETKNIKVAFEEAFAVSAKNIWIDCSNLSSISVEAMRVIVSFLNKIEEDGVNLVLYDVKDSILEKQAARIITDSAYIQSLEASFARRLGNEQQQRELLEEENRLQEVVIEGQKSEIKRRKKGQIIEGAVIVGLFILLL